MKKHIITILVFTTGLNLFSQSKIENQIFDIGIESIERFREFLSIKNDANFKNEMKPLIEWGIINFKKYGFEVERLETPELPLLLASKVISEDLNTIKSIKGIGLKTAQRVLIELKDKMLNLQFEGEIQNFGNNTIKDEALSALEVLGYTRKQSERILDTIIQSAPDSSVEELIKEALNKL